MSQPVEYATGRRRGQVVGCADGDVVTQIATAKLPGKNLRGMIRRRGGRETEKKVWTLCGASQDEEQASILLGLQGEYEIGNVLTAR
jgi:hypothetical protein